MRVEAGVAGIILAGGKGTRLYNTTKNRVQKVMVEVGGKPLLRHNIDLLSSVTERLILCVGHRAEDVSDWVRKQECRESIELNLDEIPGVTSTISSAISRVSENLVVCCNGDEIRSGLNMADVLKFHFDEGSVCTMVATLANRLYRHRVLSVRRSDSLLVSSRLRSPEFRETPDEYGLVNTGLLVMDRGLVDCFDASSSDWGGIIDPLCERGLIRVCVAPEMKYFNVGTDEELQEARLFFNEFESKGGLGAT